MIICIKNAEYVYCSVKDGLSDQKAEQMFERRMKAYAEMAESLDDEVGMVMLPEEMMEMKTHG